MKHPNAGRYGSTANGQTGSYRYFRTHLWTYESFTSASVIGLYFMSRSSGCLMLTLLHISVPYRRHATRIRWKQPALIYLINKLCVHSYIHAFVSHDTGGHVCRTPTNIIAQASHLQTIIQYNVRILPTDLECPNSVWCCTFSIVRSWWGVPDPHVGF